MAVSGMRMDEARKAAAPTMAKAPGGEAGHARLHTPPNTTASDAPMAMAGVSRPPSAPARSVPAVTATLKTSSVAASAMVSSLSKLNWAGPLPLPSSAGR
ncbi:hypothetical protein D3C72_1373310 [compost metagenome]